MSSSSIAIPQKPARHFLKADFDCTKWETIEPYLQDLVARPLNSLADLEQWMLDQSEFEKVIGEHGRWIHVRTTVDTTDTQAKADYIHAFTHIFPKLSPYSFELDKKLVNCPFTKELDPTVFETTLRKAKTQVDIFREENIPLQTDLSLKESRYNEIIGAQTVTFDGKELTIQQASALLKTGDRNVREKVYNILVECRTRDKEALDELMSELIALRHQIATNAGFKTYTEYRFKELGRFDYTAADCLKFHESVNQTVTPLVDSIMAEKKNELGLDVLKPWDTDAEPSSQKALVPSTSSEDLIAKTIECFGHLDSYFAERIEIMRDMKYFDLDSRMGKGPGGYNMTMPEIGVPFVFMNAANTEHDLITMVHEGGHAVHTFLANKLPLNCLKDTPSEMAEVASMGMELMTMPYWNVYYKNEADTKRAQKNHLKYVALVLEKTCLGDAFQHWMYAYPNHSHSERREKWAELHAQFNSSLIDYSGYEQYVEIEYQRIMHFYAVPFYYIEYAFAELGAVALYKNFKKDKQITIDQYKKALSAGYTKTIPEFYKTAGVRFDFSQQYVAELMEFLKQEIAQLN